MSAPLTNKVALVTGATRGIGKGIAIALVQSGATVYITGRSSTSQTATDSIAGSLEDTQNAAKQSAGSLIACQVDHSDDEQVQQLFHRIKVEQHGQLDILVNNVYGGVRALRTYQGNPFWEADASLWDDCNNVGLRSHYIASRLAAQLMVPRQQGLIITISSWGGLSPIFGVAYGTGKSACDRLAAEMAAELVEESSATDDPQMAMMHTKFNWETPIFTGRVIAAIAAQPNTLPLTGKLQIVAELAATYGIVDQENNQPASLRSLKFLLPMLLPPLKAHTNIIPNLYVPWWILLITALSAPRK